MKILTLWQPWASLIALGLKQYETRDWKTFYRGKLVIHSAKRPIDNDGIRAWLDAQELAGINPQGPSDPFFTYLNLPLGKVVAIADLTDCQQMIDTDTYGPVQVNPSQIAINSVSELEQTVGYWEQGRYALKLENIIALPKPIPAQGRQGLTNVSNALRQAIAP